MKDVFLPWYNAYRFLEQNVSVFEKNTGKKFRAKLVVSNQLMDQWILSSAHSLVEFFRTEMKKYRLYTVVPRLVKFIDTLTNWYGYYFNIVLILF